MQGFHRLEDSLTVGNILSVMAELWGDFGEILPTNSAIIPPRDEIKWIYGGILSVMMELWGDSGEILLNNSAINPPPFRHTLKKPRSWRNYDGIGGDSEEISSLYDGFLLNNSAINPPHSASLLSSSIRYSVRYAIFYACFKFQSY